MVGVLLSGCTPTADNPSTASSEPPIGPVSTITSPDQIVRPIDAYLPGEQQIIGLTLAYYGLANDCLRAHGAEGVAVPFVNPADMTGNVHVHVLQRAIESTLYGIFDPDEVALSGYDWKESVGLPAGSTGLLGPPDHMDIANACWQAIWSVDPSAGALVMGTLNEHQMPDGGPVINPQDSRMLAAYEQWSACMKEKGFVYSDPRSAPLDPQWKNPGTEAALAATAVADMDCKVSTNLVGVAVAVQSAYDQVYIDTHRDALAAWQGQLDSIMNGTSAVPDIGSFLAQATQAPSPSDSPS